MSFLRKLFEKTQKADPLADSNARSAADSKGGQSRSQRVEEVCRFVCSLYYLCSLCSPHRDGRCTSALDSPAGSVGRSGGPPPTAIISGLVGWDESTISLR